MTTLRSSIFSKYPMVAKHHTKVFGYISTYTFIFVHENSRQKADLLGRSLECDSVSFFQNIKTTIIHRIFQSNSSFHMKWYTTGKVYSRFFKRFLLVLTKFSFWQGDWALGYHSMRFLHFPDLCEFSKIQSRLATREPTRIYHVYK